MSADALEYLDQVSAALADKECRAVLRKLAGDSLPPVQWFPSKGENNNDRTPGK